jgi:MFS family permease
MSFCENGSFDGSSGRKKAVMKKYLILFIAIIFAFTAVINVDAQTKRKRHKKHGGLATNIAIIGGSTAAGALIGRGRNGAMIGAGAGALYASSRKGAKRRHANSKYRRATKVAGGTLLGAGTGAAIGGKTGMVVGGLAGGGGTYLYTRNHRKYYRARNGKVYSVRR